MPTWVRLARTRDVGRCTTAQGGFWCAQQLLWHSGGFFLTPTCTKPGEGTGIVRPRCWRGGGKMWLVAGGKISHPARRARPLPRGVLAPPAPSPERSTQRQDALFTPLPSPGTEAFPPLAWCQKNSQPRARAGVEPRDESHGARSGVCAELPPCPPHLSKQPPGIPGSTKPASNPHSGAGLLPAGQQG